MRSKTRTDRRTTLLCLSVLLLGALFGGCLPQPADEAAREASAEPAPSPSTLPAPSGEPLRGTIGGQPFAMEAATLESGILKVRQGEDFFADLAVTLFLFLDPGELPEGRTWKVAADSTDFGHPHVHVSVKGESDSVPSTEMFMNGYELELSFGEIADLTIPGQLSLRLEGPPATEIRGSFSAELKGLVLKDGVADRRVDGIETLKWLADDWLREQVTKDVEIVDHHGTMFRHAGADGRRPTGWTEVEYRTTPEARIEEARLRFVKQDDGWTIDQRFDATSLYPAHPLQAPDPTEPFVYFSYVAARELEARHAGTPIYEADFRTSYGADEGKVEVTYKVGSRDAETTTTSFRFVPDENGGWSPAES